MKDLLTVLLAWCMGAASPVRVQARGYWNVDYDSLVKQNMRQISQLGQRTTSLIKGMLEHSRTGTAQPVLTDLNALADEGFYNVNKAFCAQVHKDLDPCLGTGLGFSLSYDIVTKGHGGTLAVESREGKDTEFLILLPGWQTA